MILIQVAYKTKNSISKCQKERDVNNQRERLMVEFNTIQGKTFRMLISFENFKRPLSEKYKFNLEAFQERIQENMFDFINSKALLINKLRIRIRIPDIEEKLGKLDETSTILSSIHKEAMKRIDTKISIKLDEVEIAKLMDILEEIYDVILTSKIN